MSGADDLFSTDTVAPIHDRLGRARRLAALAAPLVVLGPTCFTGVPGAVLALIAWQTADEELARTESGALPPDLGPKARRLRALAFALCAASALSFILQIILFFFGFYQFVLANLVGLLTGAEPVP